MKTIVILALIFLFLNEFYIVIEAKNQSVNDLLKLPQKISLWNFILLLINNQNSNSTISQFFTIKVEFNPNLNLING